MKYFRGIILVFFVTSFVFAEGVHLDSWCLSQPTNVNRLAELGDLDPQGMQAQNSEGRCVRLAPHQDEAVELYKELVKGRDGASDGHYIAVSDPVSSLLVSSVRVQSPTTAAEAARGLRALHSLNFAVACHKRAALQSLDKEAEIAYDRALKQKEVFLLGRSADATTSDSSGAVSCAFHFNPVDPETQEKRGILLSMDNLGTKEHLPLDYVVEELRGKGFADLDNVFVQLSALLNASTSADTVEASASVLCENGRLETSHVSTAYYSDPRDAVLGAVKATLLLSSVPFEYGDNQHVGGSWNVSLYTPKALFDVLKSQNFLLPASSRFSDARLDQLAIALSCCFKNVAPSSGIFTGHANLIEKFAHAASDPAVVKKALDTGVPIEVAVASAKHLLGFISSRSKKQELKEIISRVASLSDVDSKPQLSDLIDFDKDLLTLSKEVDTLISSGVPQESLGLLKNISTSLETVRQELTYVVDTLKSSASSYEDSAANIFSLLALGGPGRYVENYPSYFGVGQQPLASPVGASTVQLLAKSQDSSRLSFADRIRSQIDMLDQADVDLLGRNIMSSRHVVSGVDQDSKKVNLSVVQSKEKFDDSCRLSSVCKAISVDPNNPELLKQASLPLSEACVRAEDAFYDNKGLMIEALDTYYKEFSSQLYAKHYQTPAVDTADGLVLRTRSLLKGAEPRGWREVLRSPTSQIADYEYQALRATLIQAQLSLAQTYLEDRVSGNLAQSLKVYFSPEQGEAGFLGDVFQRAQEDIVGEVQALNQALDMASDSLSSNFVNQNSAFRAIGLGSWFQATKTVYTETLDQVEVSKELSQQPVSEDYTISFNPELVVASAANKSIMPGGENAALVKRMASSLANGARASKRYLISDKEGREADEFRGSLTSYTEARKNVASASKSYLAEAGARSESKLPLRTFSYVVSKLDPQDKLTIENDLKALRKDVSAESFAISSAELASVLGLQTDEFSGFIEDPSFLAVVQATSGAAVGASGVVVPAISSIRMNVSKSTGGMIVSRLDQGVLELNLSYTFLEGLKRYIKKNSEQSVAKAFQDVVVQEHLSIAVAATYLSGRSGEIIDAVAVLPLKANGDKVIEDRQHLAMAMEMATGALYRQGAKVMEDIDGLLLGDDTASARYNWAVMNQVYDYYTKNYVTFDEVFYFLSGEVSLPGYADLSQTHSRSFMEKIATLPGVESEVPADQLTDLVKAAVNAAVSA